MNKRWTEREEEELIDLYRMHECLWNTRIKEYHNKDMKNAALLYISTALDVTVEEVKKKIHTLRTYFTSLLRKERKNHNDGGDADGKSTSTWIHRSKLNFLIETHTRRTTSILELHDDDVNDQLAEETRIKNEIFIADMQDSSENEESLEATAVHHQEDDVSHSSIDKNVREITREAERAARRSDSEDSCSLFGKLITEELREMSPYKQDLAKLKIRQIIFELKHNTSLNNSESIIGQQASTGLQDNHQVMVSYNDPSVRYVIPQFITQTKK